MSMSARTGPSAAVICEASSTCRRGTTRTCNGDAGEMSLKATVVSVLCTISEGTSPATILQKRQSLTGQFRSLVGFAAFQRWVEMLELARLDAARLNETVDIFHFDTDHSTEPIGRQVPFVNEPVKAAQRHAHSGGGFLGPEPFHLIAH